MRIEIASFNSAPYHHSLLLREEVLRKPLGMEVTKGDVFDEDKHIHIVAIEDERVVGVVVLVPEYEPQTGKLRQMATYPEYRARGFGKALAWQLERQAKRLGMNKVVLHARHHALDFYKRIGYKVTSEVFTEVGIDHYRMEKELS